MKTSTIAIPEIQVVTVGEIGRPGPPGAPGVAGDTVLSALNADSEPLMRGMPVYMHSTGTVIRASALSNARVVGFVQDAIVYPGNFGLIQTDGQFMLTFSEWAPVIGSGGGLLAGARYFLANSPGMITQSPDITAVVAFLGRAGSAEQLIIDIDPPIFP